MTLEAQLSEIGLSIPSEPDSRLAPGHAVGDVITTSGRTSPQHGKVGSDVSIDEAKNAARDATLRALAAVATMAGSLDRLERVLRIDGFVNCTPDFHSTSAVIDGASELVYALLGPEAGRHSRIAVGVSSLPNGAAVEIVLTVRLRPSGLDGPMPCPPVERVGRVSDEILATLGKASTATISTELNRLGYSGVFLTGVAPLRPDLKMIGRAVTLRYIPSRRDLGDVTFDNRTNKQRLAVEMVGPDDVLVIDCRGDVGTASLGHILATRMMIRGAAGIVTDGAFRDYMGVKSLSMPTFSAGRNADISATRHHPVAINEPIACGGVSVLPGDVMVGDGDGVIVIPAGIAAQVADAASIHEERERFIRSKIRAGFPITDVYPPSAAMLTEWEQWRQGDHD